MNKVLKSSQVDIWRLEPSLSKDEDVVVLATDLLSQDELVRAKRFVRPILRDRYLRAHMAKRLVLARYLDVKPSEINILTEERGKPYLAHSELHFSLSHSGDDVAIAVALAPLGVDVERHRKMDNAMAIAERYFSSDEWLRLSELEEPALPRAFFQLWVLKEAFLKMTGEGIGEQLAEIAWNVDGLGKIKPEKMPDAFFPEAISWFYRSISADFDLACVVNCPNCEFSLNYLKKDAFFG